jgi:uncharacterized protein YijF (DUF1287 family)
LHNILTKLNRRETDYDHRRVLAVITYLEAHRYQEPALTTLRDLRLMAAGAR